jgi:hypothetical protein
MLAERTKIAAGEAFPRWIDACSDARALRRWFASIRRTGFPYIDFARIRHVGEVDSHQPTPLALRPCRRASARHKEKEAYAEQDVDFCLSARPGGSPSLIMLAAGGAGGGGAGLLNGENATAGTAAANASTPAAKMNPAGAKPSSPSAGDPAATQPANNK